MKAKQFTRAELEDEIRDTNRRIKSRLSYIQSKNKNDLIPNPSVRIYNEIEYTPKDIKNLSDEELRNYYRDLKYVDNLRTTHVSGYENYKEHFKDVEEKLESYSKSQRDKFWNSYQKFVEERGGEELYKYEMFDIIIEQVEDGIEENEIVKNVGELYDKIQRDFEGGRDEHKYMSEQLLHSTRKFSTKDR